MTTKETTQDGPEDMRITQKLPICEAWLHATAVIAFWERTADAAGFAEVHLARAAAIRCPDCEGTGVGEPVVRTTVLCSLAIEETECPTCKGTKHKWCAIHPDVPAVTEEVDACGLRTLMCTECRREWKKEKEVS